MKIVKEDANRIFLFLYARNKIGAFREKE